MVPDGKAGAEPWHAGAKHWPAGAKPNFHLERSTPSDMPGSRYHVPDAANWPHLARLSATDLAGRPIVVSGEFRVS